MGLRRELGRFSDSPIHQRGQHVVLVDCQLSHCWEFFVFTMLHSWVILPQFTPVHSDVGEQAQTIALVATAPTVAVPCLPRSSIRVGSGHDSPISRNFYRSSQRVSRFCYVCNCATCSRLDIDTGFADEAILCERSPNCIRWAIAPTDARRRFDCCLIANHGVSQHDCWSMTCCVWLS